MFVSLEVTPPKRRVEKLFGILSEINGYVDAVNITDTPLGRPRTPSFTFAYIIKRFLKLEPIVHLKTINMNRVALKSIVYGCVNIGVQMFLIMRGDPPVEGTHVSDTSPEMLVSWIKEELPEAKAGLTAGWPTSIERLVSKLKAKPDYLFTQVFFTRRDAERFIGVFKEASREAGWRPPVYYTHIVLVPGNWKTVKAVAELSGIELPELRMGLERSLEFVEDLSSIFDGVMVSSPGDYKAAVKLVKALSKR